MAHSITDESPTYDGHKSSPVIRALNEPFIKYYPSFARAFGGSDEAILLQHLIDWTRLSEDGWVYRTWSEIEEATCVTRRRQYDAFKNLQSANVITVELRGAPACNYYKVDQNVLSEAFIPPSRCANSPIQLRELAHLDVRTRPSLYKEIEQRDSTNREKPKKVISERATQIPDDFALTDERFNYAAGKGMDKQRIENTFEKFTNYWQGAGKPKKDWTATWRNWVMNELERNPRSVAKTTSTADDLFAYARELREQGR